MVKPISMPKENFRSYKEKVIYILQNFTTNLSNPNELNWCLHVIQNDFLQISNSLMTSTPSGIAQRRFSKT